ncbi:hypothetical protein [Poriferisphaera sp. WC338]|uniref:hypothetical protein n=1 Tax=Poriferisphaera sp. WC338 TaxID=3425129 RepID=UPI003D81C099
MPESTPPFKPVRLKLLSENERTCGSCTACCTQLSISCLGKPAHVPCDHLSPSGCTNYKNRPTPCRGFTCLWLADQGKLFNDSHRPDKLGIMFSPSGKETTSLSINAHELTPNTIAKPEVQHTIDYLRQFFPVKILQHHLKHTANTSLPKAAQSLTKRAA